MNRLTIRRTHGGNGDVPLSYSFLFRRSYMQSFRYNERGVSAGAFYTYVFGKRRSGNCFDSGGGCYCGRLTGGGCRRDFSPAVFRDAGKCAADCAGGEGAGRSAGGGYGGENTRYLDFAHVGRGDQVSFPQMAGGV